MDIYTVSFFGHREVERALEIESRLDHLLHDLIPDLYTDAYIHGAVSGLDAVFLTDAGKPAGSFPAYAHHDLRSVKLSPSSVTTPFALPSSTIRS